jgi:hypothetical protein
VLIKYSTESGVEQEIREGVKQLNKGQGHTGEIPYQCNSFERAFVENSKLTRHKNKYVCYYCDQLSLSM